jgi:hypothetical protein
MHNSEAPLAAPPPDPAPFAVCRFCTGAIQRTEMVAIFVRSKRVAHIRCRDHAERKAACLGLCVLCEHGHHGVPCGLCPCESIAARRGGAA